MGQATTVHWEKNVRCDLCGSDSHEALYQDETYGYTFVRCRSCGLMFYNPRYEEQYVINRFLRAGDAQIEAESMIENGVFFGEPPGGAEAEKNTLKDYYRHMLTEHTGRYRELNGRPPDSMFEVGTSVGWYMKVARDEFLVAPGRPLVQGCDANVYSALIAQKTFGLDVRDCTFSLYRTTPDQIHRFSIVTMLDYIEHSYTPFRDLKKLADLTERHGVLILKTFLEELDPKGSYVHPIFHAHHFTEEALRRAIEQAGWKIQLFDKEREGSLGLVTVFAERGP